MAEVSHGTGDQTLEDGGLQELCAILKAGGFEDLIFFGLREKCQDRWHVRFGHRDMHIPCGPEVEYTDLMQAIGECTNLKTIFFTQNFSLCNYVLGVQLCKALCKNHSVSKLIIDLAVDGSQDCQPNFDILLDQVVVMLESNVGLKDFRFVLRSLHAPTFWSSDGFANALERNRTLECFHMQFHYLPSEQELQRLVQPLIADGNGQQKNSTLIKLQLYVYQEVDEESMTVAANVLAKMLQKNSSLKELSLWAQKSSYSVDSFAEALETNDTLGHLKLRGRFLNLQRLLQPLTVDANGQQSNATLLKLTLQQSTFVKQNDMQFHTSIVDPLTKMLQSNSSLTELDLSYTQNFTESDVCALIKSLESNHSLQVLNFDYCNGVSGTVFPAIMDMLVVNKTVKVIHLKGTTLDREGKGQIVNQELEKNAVYMSLLKELPVAKATSARVFLCGYPYAGKTTLRKGLVRCLAHGSTFSKIFLTPILDFFSKLKDGLRQTQRTHGIEIRDLKVTQGVNLSIWDMAEIVTNLNTKFAKVVDVASKPVTIDSHSSRSARLVVKLIQENVQALLKTLPPVYEVSLHNKFVGPDNQMIADYTFKENAISILYDGIEILVEFDNDVSSHIDVLVRSTEKEYDEALDIVHERITKHIQTLRGAFDGCQGIILLEGIVRKECVERRVPFKSRLDQAILVEDLKKRILAKGSNWQSWQHTWRELNFENDTIYPSFEIAINMMGSEERDDVWRRLSPQFKSHELNQNLVITGSKFDQHQRAFAPTSIEEAIQAVHKDVKAVHTDVKILVKSSMQTVPRFYLFTTKGFKQRLVAKLVQGMKVVQLHLLCECRECPHKVKGKEGCEVIIENHQWQKIHAAIFEGLKWVVPAINAGLHITMGFGNIIPNPAEVLNVIGANFIGSVQDRASSSQDQLQMGVESVEKQAAEQWVRSLAGARVLFPRRASDRLVCEISFKSSCSYNIRLLLYPWSSSIEGSIPFRPWSVGGRCHFECWLLSMALTSPLERR
ncbi:unnamed protein product [Sphagnum jensenii]|uniref:Uncharacterized protein n=1 Tax=Sphagnum jensenii TaxID=128206 RepID=A0ABP1B997_9BRYO